MFEPVPMAPTDPYGRLSIPATRAQTGERKRRQWTSTKWRSRHRTRSGIADPFTFFQLLDALLNLKPNQQFKAAELAKYLNDAKPMFHWHPVTVGRILNDLIESFATANHGGEFQPIATHRHYRNGGIYWMTDYPQARTVAFNLMDDLVILCNQLADEEAQGRRPRRLSSPLGNCPSLVSFVHRPD